MALMTHLLGRRSTILYLALVLIVGWFTYVKNYAQPPYLFWDENYHIASAQKYLDGVFFMEPHPPLGKLLIALGEYLVHPNDGKNVEHFLTTDHIKTIPEGYSFAGVRLIPTVMAWLTGGLVFIALTLALLNPHLAAVFSCLYLFDNALILHSRSAMLEGSQLFFLMSAFVIFLLNYRRQEPIRLGAYLSLSVVLGLALAVKANSTIALPLLPLLAWIDIDRRKLSFAQAAQRTVVAGGVSAVSLGMVFLATWAIHFHLCTKVVDGRWYNASTEYKEILAQGTNNNVFNYPVMLQDSFQYFTNYQKGVPRLDVCKSGENGSYPLSWTVGIKSINYRWEKTNDGRVRYLYLQSNPVVWFTGLTGIIVAAIYAGSILIFGMEPKSRERFFLILLFLVGYLGYLGTMMQVDRVMYLYHYFIPLLFSFMVSALVFQELLGDEFEKRDRYVLGGVMLFLLQILLVFKFFAPFTYYDPIGTSDFWRRSWVSGWRLEPII